MSQSGWKEPRGADPKPPYSYLILRAVAVGLDEHRFSVAQEPIQHRAGEGAVVGEDFGPLSIGMLGSQHERALLIPLADDLEEQVCARFVDGQLAQFVHSQDGGFEAEISFCV